MRSRRSWLLSFAALGVGLSLFVAGTSHAGKEINWSKVREVSRKGPFSMDLREKVTARIPTGYRFVTEDKLSVYHELIGDTPVPEEAGVILPEEGGWVVEVTFPKEDPLKDQDPKQLNVDALMKWNERALEEAQPKRTAQGLPVQRVTGWTHKPAYDADGKRLTMGLRVGPADDRSNGKKDELHYKTLIYGPDEGQFVCLETVTAIGNWDKPLEETKKLATEFTYKNLNDASGDEDQMYYAKIGGAGLIGVIAVVVGAKLLGGRRPEAVPPARAAARRFGTPR
jgi:uncharacterized membrane-anchored protein